MEQKVTDISETQVAHCSIHDELLDLGDFQQASVSSAEEFVLDIDLDEVPETASVEGYPAYAGSGVLRTSGRDLTQLPKIDFRNRKSTATVERHASNP